MARVPWAKVGAWLIKAKVWILVVLKPFGVWGVLGLAVVDSAAIPLPLDLLVVSYGTADHARCLLYCVVAAVGSAAGSMLPYYLGRAGGELFLLKRINRARYEKLRDRFERQEFLAIMVPAMLPPPMPVKLFELAAGVFEMKPMNFFIAIACGKFIRFLVESLLVILYGPAILNESIHLLQQHLHLVLTGVGLLGMALLIWVVRRLFDRRRGVSLPLEDAGPDAIEPDPNDVL
jgi:membrane protein YqaA with SNARE-associated domain